MAKSIVFICLVSALSSIGLCVAVAPAAAAGLEVYLPLDGDLLDDSGNGRNGVLTDGSIGTNAYVTDGGHSGIEFGLQSGYIPGEDNTKTGNDYVTVNYHLPESGSISIWKKLADRYSFQTVWDNSGSAESFPGDSWECWLNSSKDGKLYARAADGEDGRWDDAENNATFIRLKDTADYGVYPDWVDQWCHITVTWDKLPADKVEMKMYVNGVLVDTCPQMTWQEPGNEFYLASGNAANTAGIGVWDELGIWSEKLTDAEVMVVYTDGILALANAVPGDTNYDGVVDDTDATTLANNWLSIDNVGWSEGDFNEDGIVDESDAAVLAANWQIGTSAAASVPEPNALVLIALGCFMLLGRRSLRKL